MAAPAYSSAGAGVGTITSAAALNPACPATVTAGDLLIAHIRIRDTTTSPNQAPAGWVLLDGPRTASTTGRQWIYGKIAIGNEDGVAVTFDTSAVTVARSARIYRFTGNRFVTGVVAAVGGFAYGTNTTAAVADTGVTTPEADCLAVNFVGVDDNNALASFTGETGGDWTEAVAEYTHNLGTGASLQLQTATMATAGTVNGGSTTMTLADPWGNTGFYIRAPHPAGVDPITVDVVSRSGTTDSDTFTTSDSWSHAAGAAPKGVVVTVAQPLATTNDALVVTYGGVAMGLRVTQAGTGGEDGRAWIFNLSTGIPGGTQTVAISGGGAGAKQATCVTLNGDADLQITVDVSGGTDLGIAANPSLTANFTETLTGWFGIAAHLYGGAAPVSTGLQAGETYAFGVDPGAAVAMTYYRNDLPAAASTTFGYTTLASDDQHIVWAIFKQVIQYSLTVAIEEDSALPIWKFKGRIATLTPDATDKGDWDAVVGAASHHAAVTDASDSSYIETSTNGDIDRFTLTTTTLNAGEFVSGVRVRVKATTNQFQTVAFSTMTYAKVDRIPESMPIAVYTSMMFPGSGDALTASFGVMNQTMINGLKVQLVANESSAQAATIKVYEIAVDLYISTAASRVTKSLSVAGNKLIFEDGSACRFVGVNWPENLLETPVSETKERLLAHKEAGYNLFRFHIPTASLRDSADYLLAPMAVLTEVLQWMNDEDLYADITMNASYRTEDNPAWYEAHTESERWIVRRNISRLFTGTFVDHPAVAFYSLMNEGRAPDDVRTYWRFGDTDGTRDEIYSEHIVKDPAGRTRAQIWDTWLAHVMSVTDGVKLVAPNAIVGVGKPGSVENITNASAVTADMGVLLPHIYPKRTDTTWLAQLREAVQTNRPVVLEEFFVDVVTNDGWLPEMDQTYAHLVDYASGICVMSQGLTAAGYPVGVDMEQAIHKMVLLWMEERMSQFKHTPKYSLRAGSRAIPPRFGYRL